MQYSNYQQCIKHIANLTDFRSNSLCGYNAPEGFYVVSYNTTIAFIKRDFSVVALNVQKYSVTTSKQQTYVRRAVEDIRKVHPALDVVEVEGWQSVLRQAVGA